MGRTNEEQRLKGEIGAKNFHAAQLREVLAEIAKFRRQAGETGKRRRQKKLTATVDRLESRAGDLRACVLPWGADLEKRIREEMKISEDEVREFQKRYEKELAEYRQAHAEAKAKIEEHQVVAHSWRHASEEERKRLREIEGAAAKAQAKAQAKEEKEKKEAEKVAQEIDSEARDKAFFNLELKRIAVEQVAFKK